MSFSDDLIKESKVDSSERYYQAVEVVCNDMRMHKIKEQCMSAAKEGATTVTVRVSSYEYFPSHYRPIFSVRFGRKDILVTTKFRDKQRIVQIVSDTIGAQAEELGLLLESVECHYSSNSDACSSNDISAVFKWGSQNSSYRTEYQRIYPSSSSENTQHGCLFYCVVAALGILGIYGFSILSNLFFLLIS